MCVMCVVLARAPQAQQRRITELEARLDATQRAAAQHAALTTAAQRRAGELQEELENNAGAQPHYRVLRRTLAHNPRPGPDSCTTACRRAPGGAGGQWRVPSRGTSTLSDYQP